MNKKLEHLVLKATGLYKSFKQGHNQIKILEDASFTLRSNEVVAIIGPSGCGKTTFLQTLGLLDKADKGTIIINDVDYTNTSDYKKTLCRRLNIGFIYQAYNLLNDFSALENVMLPLRIQGMSYGKALKRASEALQKLGLENRLLHLPGQLSGGEQQRVAIARSIVHEPSIILADEPTGNLDHANSLKITDLLIELVKNLKTSLVIVTHNLEVAAKADRTVAIQDGKVQTLNNNRRRSSTRRLSSVTS